MEKGLKDVDMVVDLSQIKVDVNQIFVVGTRYSNGHHLV